MKKNQLLKDIFGYTAFRPGQEACIDSLLSGRDVVAVMPTGAGKSICYQIPALLLPGMSIVVSPLISLMKDQMDALADAGVAAACLNSSLSQEAFQDVLYRACAGQYKLLYVAPERLFTQAFLDLARQCRIAMVAVDEAHCISQWGQDFRPAYLRIRDFISELPERPVLAAFTATATTKVKADIAELLALHSPFSITTGFDRKNLHFAVRKPQDKWKELRKYVLGHRQSSGIVYCATRKTVEAVCDKLVHSGVSATRYHAGLSEEERRRNQDDFVMDRSRVMVATNAFGMGIDKSNVAYVIHYNMPKNLESYYQEAGRAGRDGDAADCVLLYGAQDVITNKFLIERAQPNQEEENRMVRERGLELLKQMTFYCHSHECLRRYILNYFGETAENHCGNCSSCQSHFEASDITVDAQKIMSCIRRAGERYGVKLIVDVLRGQSHARISSLGLNELSTYGIMKESGENAVREVMEYLLLHGYLRKTEDEYPVLKLTERSSDVLFGGVELTMMRMKPKPMEDRDAGRSDKRGNGKSGTGRSRKRQSDNGAEMEDVNSGLFERLRALRMQLARQTKVPPYVIFSDATLRDMCRILPATEEAFLEVSGVGMAKLKKYGKLFMSEIGSERENKDQALATD